jgi:hypothetical protein
VLQTHPAHRAASAGVDPRLDDRAGGLRRARRASGHEGAGVGRFEPPAARPGGRNRRAGRLAALRLRRAAQRRLPVGHRHRRQRYREAPAAGGPYVGRRRLLGSRTARGAGGRSRARPDLRHHHLRKDDRHRPRNRHDRVAVRAAGHYRVPGQLADHNRHADHRPRPRISTSPPPTARSTSSPWLLGPRCIRGAGRRA